MLWRCPYLEAFWKYIIATVSDITKSDIPCDPRIWLLGDINLLNITQYKKYFVLLAGTAGKNVFSSIGN